MMDLAKKRILVTGAHGFLGSFVMEALEKRGVEDIIAPSIEDVNLLDTDSMVKMLKETKPELIIHLAAICGGIGANRREPGRFFYENLKMGIELMHHSYLEGVEKFVSIGTVCAYPKFTEVPFKEDDLWEGYPEETNAPYGLAKKMLLVQAQSYRAQYGFNSIYLLPVNLYGPRDNFDLEDSHVIPALIRKFITAKENGDKTVKLWGTGSPTREFQYVEDCAEGILLAAEKFDKSDPVNLGSGEEISIRDLAELISGLTEYEGEIIWDDSQPDGQPRRLLDVSRAWNEFGYKAQVSLSEGIKKTIDWYLANRAVADR